MEYLINFLFIKSLSFYLIFWLFFHILTDFKVYPSQIARLGKIYPLLFVYILSPFFFSYFSVFYCIFSSRISCILSDFAHLPICCEMAHLENLYFSICQLDWKISRHYILTWINHFQHQWQEKASVMGHHYHQRTVTPPALQPLFFFRKTHLTIFYSDFWLFAHILSDSSNISGWNCLFRKFTFGYLSTLCPDSTSEVESTIFNFFHIFQ